MLRGPRGANMTTVSICPICKGHEQVWGVRWRGPLDTGWMGRSAFLQWTGTETQAETVAAKQNNKRRADDTTVYAAEQLTCSRRGQTTRRGFHPDEIDTQIPEQQTWGAFIPAQWAKGIRGSCERVARDVAERILRGTFDYEIRPVPNDQRD